MMELSTLANLAEVFGALVVVGSVAFAFVQLAHFRRQRSDMAAVELARSFQTPEFTRAIRLVLSLPDGASAKQVKSDPTYEDAAMLVSLTLESVGIMVHRRVISIDMVWELMGGMVCCRPGGRSARGHSTNASSRAGRSSTSGYSGCASSWSVARTVTSPPTGSIAAGARSVPESGRLTDSGFGWRGLLGDKDKQGPHFLCTAHHVHLEGNGFLVELQLAVDAAELFTHLSLELPARPPCVPGRREKDATDDGCSLSE